MVSGQSVKLGVFVFFGVLKIDFYHNFLLNSSLNAIHNE